MARTFFKEHIDYKLRYETHINNMLSDRPELQFKLFLHCKVRNTNTKFNKVRSVDMKNNIMIEGWVQPHHYAFISIVMYMDVYNLNGEIYAIRRGPIKIV